MPETQPAYGPNGPARVAVVAAGVISPLGSGLEETAESLRIGRDCVTPIARFSVEQCRCKTAGQVREDQMVSVGSDRRRRRMHRASHMMIRALNEALAKAPGFQPQLTIVGTTSGGMTFGEEYYRAL